MSEQPQIPAPDDATPARAEGSPDGGSERSAETDVASTAAPPAPTVFPPPGLASGPASTSEKDAGVADRPEIAVGAAFAGGFMLALILKRIAR